MCPAVAVADAAGSLAIFVLGLWAVAQCGDGAHAGIMGARKVAILTAAVVLLLAGCSGDDTAEPAAPETTGRATSEPETSEPETSEPAAPEPTGDDGTPSAPASGPATIDWPTDDVSEPFEGTAPPVPTLVDLRVGSHPDDGYDRVALEFDELPGYEIGYRDDIVYDGSGEPVDLTGSAFIQLVFTPAQAHDDEGNSTIDSPPVEPVDVGFAALESYVLNGDFEGYVSVALGLNGEVGFQVGQFLAANGNTVIYIDLARP